MNVLYSRRCDLRQRESERTAQCGECCEGHDCNIRRHGGGDIGLGEAGFNLPTILSAYRADPQSRKDFSRGSETDPDPTKSVAEPVVDLELIEAMLSIFILDPHDADPTMFFMGLAKRV